MEVNTVVLLHYKSYCMVMLVNLWDKIQNNYPIVQNIHTEAKLTT